MSSSTDKSNKAVRSFSKYTTFLDEVSMNVVITKSTKVKSVSN